MNCAAFILAFVILVAPLYWYAHGRSHYMGVQPTAPIRA